MSPRSPWRSPRPGAIRRSASLLLVPLACLALTSTAAPASAAPSDQPGGTSGVLDSRALDELQQRAADVQRGLQSQQGEVEAARAALGDAERAVADAEGLLGDAEGELAGLRQLVARYAAAVYRDGGAITPLSVLLGGGDPGDVVSALGFLEVVDRHAATVIGEAEVQRQAAVEQQQRATAALEQARARADEVGARAASTSPCWDRRPRCTSAARRCSSSRARLSRTPEVPPGWSLGAADAGGAVDARARRASGTSSSDAGRRSALGRGERHGERGDIGPPSRIWAASPTAGMLSGSRGKRQVRGQVPPGRANPAASGGPARSARRPRDCRHLDLPSGP